MNSPVFIESIKVKDGEWYNLPLHLKRMESTIHHFYGTVPASPFIETSLPDLYQKGIWKCRIVYSNKIESVEFLPYTFRSFHSIRLVEDNEIDYNFKWMNRERLNQLYDKREDHDDILIIRNGQITDTSFSNVVFENEEGFFTPTSYLLNGIKRRYLLSKGIIQEREITPKDIQQYNFLYFINAMIDLEDEIKVNTKNIF